MLKVRDLKIWQKLTLIIVAAALMIPVVTYILVSDRFADIAVAQKELQGIEYLKPVKKFVEHVPQHRGTANGYLNGNLALKDRLATIETLIDQDIRQIREIDARYGAALGTTQTINDLEKSWQELKGQYITLSPKESFDRHTQLIARINDFIALVGDTSGLILDPQRETYYAAYTVTREIPSTAESLGQLRGFGNGIASRKAYTQEEYGRFSAIQESVRQNVANYTRSVKAVAQSNPEVGRILTPKYENVTAKIGEYLQLGDERLIKAKTIDIPSVEYFDRGTRIIDEVFAVYDDQINLIDAALRARVAQSQRTAYVVLFAVILAAVATALIAVFVARTIARQLNAITGVVRELEQENLAARAAVLNGDELGQVASSVNAMLDNTVNLIQVREKERDERERERDELEDALIRLLSEIRNVAQGDLTIQASVDEGPTGALADSFNYTLSELRRLIGRVNEVSARVNRAAREIQNTSTTLAQGSEVQFVRINETSSALKEMSESITEVSKRAQTSVAVAEQSLQKAQVGMKAVSKTIDGMQNIREQVQKTAKRIKRLGESSQEVGEIVQLIGDIANQTNILALNASIQAAMAGEAGRGFAVVAEEVELLAERSADATKRIGGLIKAIQTETNEAVAAMEDTTREVVEGSAVATEAGQALNEIENVSNQLARIIEAISIASKEQAARSEGLAGTMGNISEITQGATLGTREMVSSVSELTSLADNLRASVSQFKVSKEAAVNGVNGNQAYGSLTGELVGAA
jgi:twitching motility protein PilJ